MVISGCDHSNLCYCFLEVDKKVKTCPSFVMEIMARGAQVQ